MFSNYRPQRKVMFSQVSVILSQHNKMYHNVRPPVDTGPLWTLTSPSPWTQTSWTETFPLDRDSPTPLDRDPPGQGPLRNSHLVAATAVVGTHPTVMHSCLFFFF